LHQYFVQDGKLIHRISRGDAKPIDTIISDTVNVFDKPVTVAVSIGTAGGAKVLAAVLQGRATVVGPAMNPGVPCQVAYPVEQQHYLVLSSAHYQLPNGAPLNTVYPDELMKPRPNNYESEMGGSDGLSPSEVAQYACKVLHELVRDQANRQSSH
jgi:C-terminal processing protease CtpA/Prc